MKKILCVFLMFTLLLTGCQVTPVDGPSTQTPIHSETPDVNETPEPTPEETIIEIIPTETPEETITGTPEQTPGETPNEQTPPTESATQPGTSAPTGNSTPTKNPTTPTKKPTSTPTPKPTPTPDIKTFSIAIHVSGGASASGTKLNFKGYYKNNDETSGVIVVAQNGTASFTVTGKNSDWQYSTEYSFYGKNIMKVTTSGNKATVNVTLKTGVELTKKEASKAHFVYVPKKTVNNGIPTLLLNVEDYNDYYDLTVSNDRSVEDIWYNATYAMVEGTKKTYDTTNEQGTLRIKRRGYSSFDKDKKPYTIKLDDGKALLDMNKNRDWVLVANYCDKSLLRNYFAYTISRQMNTSWASDCRFVDVYLTCGTNNNYLGTYMLTEKIEAVEDKVNITEMTAEDTNIGAISASSSMSKALAGSFLVEVETFDRASTGDMLINTGRYPLSVKSPDKDLFAPDDFFEPEASWTWPDTHLATKNSNLAEYIRTFMIVVDDAIHTDNYDKYEPYIDIDSFVDYYILNELAKNVDGNFRLSTYFYKDKGGKLKIVVWDFDIAFGNCDYGSDSYGKNCGEPTGYYIRTETSWYRHLFKSYKFRDKVSARWKELRKGCLSDSAIDSMLSAKGNEIKKSANANFDRWPILGEYVWPNSQEIVNCKTYEEQVEQLISWLQRRADWLDDNIAKAVV